MNSTPLSLEYYRHLQAKSLLYRKTLIKLIYTSKAGHTGGSLSCVDILNVLYNHVMDIVPQNFHQVDRDHYIHSKGHAVEALYAVLADKGFFPWENWILLKNLVHVLSVIPPAMFRVLNKIQVR